jgi:hypothetical protein
VTDRLPAPVVALIDAARSWLDSGRTPAANAGIDNLTQYAQRHGMLAWAPIPPHEALRYHMTRALDGVRLLQTLTAALTRANIDAVALKGPALSQWLYGDACARRFSDLDLLVAPSQRSAALNVLEQQGFSPRLPRGSGDIVYRGIGAWPMDREGSHTVEVHWQLAGPRFPQILRTADVMERAAEIPLGTRTVRVPCPDHAAALALAHAAKHAWYALEQTFSIAAMVRRTDIDWVAVRRLAAAAGALRGAAAGVALAADLFHVDLPRPFRDDVGHPAVAELCRCARQTLALPPGTLPDRALERRMHRLAFDRAIDRLRYDVRRFVEPTHAETAWVPLPRSLSALYWPVRLIRMGVLLVQGSR